MVQLIFLVLHFVRELVSLGVYIHLFLEVTHPKCCSSSLIPCRGLRFDSAEIQLQIVDRDSN